MADQASAAAAPLASEAPLSGLREFWRGAPILFAAVIGSMVSTAALTTYMIPFFIGPLGAEFGWDRAQITTSQTFNSLGVFLACPIMGLIADRIGTQRTVSISIVLFATGLASLSLVRNPIWLFYAGYFVTAFLGTGTIYVITSRALNTWFDKARGIALGLLTCGPGIAAMIGPQILPRIIDAHGWRAGYLALAAAALCALPLTLLFLRERKVTSAVHATMMVGLSFKQVLRKRQFWAILIGIVIAQSATTGAVVNSIPMFTEAGASVAVARNAASLFGLFMIGGRIFTGICLDRLPGTLVGAIFFTAPALGFTALLLLGAPALTFYAVTLGMAVGAEGDLVAYLVSRHFGLKAYGQTNGWVYGFACLGLAVGPLLFSGLYAVAGNYHLAWIAAALLCLIAATLFATLGKYPAYSEDKAEA